MLAMHPIERHAIWPDYLRRHPTTPGETRIVVAIGRLCSLVHARTRGKDERPAAPLDFIGDLIPQGMRKRPAETAGSGIFAGGMMGIVEALKAEHEAKRKAREGAGDG